MHWGPPPNVSTFGGDIDSLFLLIFWITATAFVVTEAVLLYSVFKFKARPGGKALYVHSNEKLELVWTVIPALLLVALAIYQYGTWNKIKRDFPLPEESVQVELSPQQFLWKARYPGADSLFDTPDDVTAPNNIVHVPVDRPVLVTLKAQDVIHSFFVPQLRLKQDALPGSTIKAWFQATKPGEYEIACAELCGLGHYRMRATLTVETQAAFEQWLATTKSKQKAAAPATGAVLAERPAR